MNCSEIQELAPLYLAAELDAPRGAELRAHLDSCAECRCEIEDQIELDRRLRSELSAAAPDPSAVEARVREVIASERRRFLTPVRAALAIAASLLLAIAIVVAMRAGFSPQPVAICSDAARDHIHEIVQQEPRRWTSDLAGIDTLAGRVGVARSTRSKISLPGYQVERGRLCRLNGRVYLHLVYTSGAREFSLYLGSAFGSGRAADLYTADSNGQHTATLQSRDQRIVVVTGESADAARNLASLAARAL
jgi:anti-sigma factor RsiW